jgi:5'-methylthioadenosine phosphorylase
MGVTMPNAKIGIIGGTGLYKMEGLKKTEAITVHTPFGSPSDNYLVGELDGIKVAFLPRHGMGHRILPHELNFRANIYGFKKIGVERIISVSAVGSMREEIEPLHMVLPDQFFDRTRKRIDTFFGGGIVAHVSFSHPICLQLRSTLYEKIKELGLTVHNGGTYLCIEGPQFSTKAESYIYRSWKVDIIGMTNLQEAKLAREAEICYATIALVTDYDCWREDEDNLSIEMIINNLNKNTENVKNVIRKVVPEIVTLERNCPCCSALKNAIITQEDMIPDTVKEDLAIIIGKHIKG